jgi:hypothetical protein
MACIHISGQQYDALLNHLTATPESVAFMRCAPPEADRVFRVDEVRLISAREQHSRADDHCELADDVRADVIRWAWNSGGCLIEAHSHGSIFGPPQFSRFDLTQLSEWVPHVRWRLAGRPYAALVTASREVDGLAWIDDRPEAVDRLVVDGVEFATSGQSIRSLETDHAQ